MACVCISITCTAGKNSNYGDYVMDSLPFSFTVSGDGGANFQNNTGSQMSNFVIKFDDVECGDLDASVANGAWVNAVWTGCPLDGRTGKASQV